MSKFNLTKAFKKTINRAGGRAFKKSPKLELVSILLTSFVQGQFYRSANEQMATVRRLIKKVDPLFAAKAAVFARNEYGMRSISHVLAAELATRLSGTEWGKDFYEAIVRRPDDMTEILSYFRTQGNVLPTNAMKKGFAKAFDKFDAYQLAKYRSENKAVKLIDIVNLCSPKPTKVNAKALELLVKGQLRSTETWEAKLTQAGKASNRVDAKSQAWESLIREGRIGYFALLRNLRNIIEQAPHVLDEALALLVDEKRIKKSLVFPFRYLTAYKMLETNDATGRKVRKALDKAINISCNNVPNLENTLVVIDNSGSMGCSVAGSNHLKCNEAGAIFGMILAKKSNADVMEFATSARYIPYDLDQSVMRFGAKFAQKNKVGHGTNFHSIFQKAHKAYDRIVIFSDMQGWIGNYTPKKAFESYCKRYSCDPFVYSFDLRGHGTLQFPENKVACVAGFSDKVFDMMKVCETDKKALVRKIEAVEF